jgi:hypothetical protein
MKRSLRTFGVALGAVLAMVATIAPAARAELTFTGLNPLGTPTPTIFRAAQTEFTEFEFRPTAKSNDIVKCTGLSFSAAASGESKALTAKPVGSAPKCRFFPGESTTIRTMNSCHFRYNITKEINADKFEGTTDIQCATKGDVIDYEVLKAPPGTGTWCTIKVEEQNGIGPIYYEDVTPFMALNYFVINAQATNVKSITEAKSGLPKDCGVTALGTHTTGTLIENTTVTGLSEELLSEVIVSG